MTIEEAKIVLAKEYHIDNFTYLAKDVLLPDYAGDVHDVWFKNDIFSTVKQLGTSEACELTVFEVYLKEGTHNRRVAITQEMFKILRGLHINNALVAFVNANEKNFRISLLTSKYEFNGDKIVKVLSNPRRFSYTLGIGMKTKTAYKFLIEKGKVKDLNELIGRFSVEVVNKQFYAEIATAFTELVGGERNGKTYTKLLQLYGSLDHNKHAEFGVRLIGRIMFCWFLREKRSVSGFPLVPDDMLSTATIDGSNNYYHQVLEPLFFELLNTPINSRKRDFDTDYYNKIPYLNGGLFSPHTDDMYRYDPILHGGRYGQVTIPNEWFKQLYQTLGQYNFTVDENTAYDIELSIDPEMLGRIFENLLAEINPETGENAKKSTGSFYTPRDIVDYMVDNSLCEYLKTKTGIDEVKLKALISYSKDDAELAVFTAAEKKKLIEALYTVTVLDPACGSGAFPIGMLQKIVYILQEIDPEANLWFDKATENVGILLKKEFEKKFNAGSLNYIRKLSVIQNSIFGIDIQPIAVEISRLRCFLSLIIEEKVDDAEENRGINPLPNLDFKFIIANSLIELDADDAPLLSDESHITSLKEIREEYFNADPSRRIELRFAFDDIQKQMFRNTIDNLGKTASARYKTLSEWEPFKNVVTNWFDPEWMFGIKDGFDIVIGNPPYLESRHSNFSDGLKDVLQAQLLSRYGKKFDLIPRGSDLLVYFYELSLRVIKEDGINVFITQNSWLDTEYGAQFQKFLLSTTNVLAILDSDFKSFETANINTVITIFQGKKGCHKDIAFARLHVRFGDYRLSIEDAKDNQYASTVTVKTFSPKDDLINSYKWGFIFNSDIQFINIISTLNCMGKKECDLPWIKIGQGLNIVKDYTYKKYNLPEDIQGNEIVPYCNVDENGYYIWDESQTFLISNQHMSISREKELSKLGYVIYDEKKTKRKRPVLILPRGIGSKHFCSWNTNNGYSASCVDIYSVDESKVLNLWIFMNTTLFWLLREISGRKSLGGGMLKAEAVDLKQFPIYFSFNDTTEANKLFKDAQGKKALNALEEIETDLHKAIDEFFYKETGISVVTQEYIKQLFIEKYSARTQKSST